MAYIMDTNEEERVKGKTVEVGRAYFETETTRFTILDAPVRYYIFKLLFPLSSLQLIISINSILNEAGFAWHSSPT
ncbi:hypothetical protein OIU84_027292 [Salix udensis]|uniref:Uncharacterized protein n=1 Tax=Salix udensis TaxID=889485 RepID=A0AAD6P9M4_9ROSI|nr:hypothetical protein OIU84_027292 [Salix udensis]